MAGLDENGLTIKRLPEVIEDIVTSEQENIDPDISTRDDELLGQLNTIFSSAIAEVWALSQAVNDNFNVLKAEGKNLDDLGVLTGTVRQAGSKSSTTNQRFVGNNGVTVLTGTILQNPITLDRFVTTNDITLDVASCISAKYSAATVLDNELYTLSVNNVEYQYTSDGDATALEILNGIKTEIDNDTTATWSATVDTINELLVITTDDANNISIVTITYLLATEVTNSGPAEAEEGGDVSAPANSVTRIVSSVSGLTSTTNPDAYILGSFPETDEEYRARILISQQASGKGTVEAILDNVSNVQGVSTATVTENDQITVDGQGRPPKSFEVVAQGGTNIDVATAIWLAKPAGIETFGDTAVVIQDSSGNQQTINFTRPDTVNMAFLVEYTLYDEEVFQPDGEDKIREAVLEFTNDLNIDEDVIPSRYFGHIYDATDGIDSLVVKTQEIANPGDPIVPGNWQTTRFPIDFKSFARTTSVDITVTEV